MATGYWVGATNGTWSTLTNWRQTASGTTAVPSFPGATGTSGDIAYFFHNTVAGPRIVKMSAAVPQPISVALTSNNTGGVTVITDNNVATYTIYLQDNGAVPAISTGTSAAFIDFASTTGFSRLSANVSAAATITLQPNNAASYIGALMLTAPALNIGNSTSGGTLGKVILGNPTEGVAFTISATSTVGTLYLGKHPTDLPTLEVRSSLNVSSLLMYRGNVTLSGDNFYNNARVTGDISSIAEDPTSTKVYVRKLNSTVVVNPPVFEMTDPDTGYGIFVPSPYTISVPVEVESGIYATNVFPSQFYLKGGGVGILSDEGTWITQVLYAGTRSTVYCEDGYDAVIGFGTITDYFGPRTAGTPYKILKLRSLTSVVGADYSTATVPAHAGHTSILCGGDTLKVIGQSSFSVSSPAVSFGFVPYKENCTLDLTAYTGDIHTLSLTGSYTNTISTPTRSFYVYGPCEFSAAISNTSGFYAATSIYLKIPDTSGGATQYLTSSVGPGQNVTFRVQQGGLRLTGNIHRASMEGGTQTTRLDLSYADVAFYGLSADSSSVINMTYASMSTASGGSGMSVAGVITGDYPYFYMDHATTLNLSGANTCLAAKFYLNYGSVTVSSPQTLDTGPLGKLSSSTRLFFGSFGYLDYSSQNTYDYSPYIATSSNRVRVDTNGQTVTWAANMTASSLQKFGEGTLRLTGSNTFTGKVESTSFYPYEQTIQPIYINGGVLEIGSSGALGSTVYTDRNTIMFDGSMATLRSDSTTPRTTSRNLLFEYDNNYIPHSIVLGLQMGTRFTSTRTFASAVLRLSETPSLVLAACW